MAFENALYYSLYYNLGILDYILIGLVSFMAYWVGKTAFFSTHQFYLKKVDNSRAETENFKKRFPVYWGIGLSLFATVLFSYLSYDYYASFKNHSYFLTEKDSEFLLKARVINKPVTGLSTAEVAEIIKQNDYSEQIHELRLTLLTKMANFEKDKFLQNKPAP